MVQDTFGKVFNEGTDFQRDGSQFDRLFRDGDIWTIGGMTAFAMLTPGHTPACMTHVIGDAAFVGDTLFMPDGGSARADFPGGDARQLYRSIKRVLSLPGAMRLFMCHDYGPNGRDIRWETTVADQNANNIHVKHGIPEDQFVAVREARDATLAMPKLIIPALQVNMRAGDLPLPDASGKRFLKVPINGLWGDARDCPDARLTIRRRIPEVATPRLCRSCTSPRSGVSDPAAWGRTCRLTRVLKAGQMAGASSDRGRNG